MGRFDHKLPSGSYSGTPSYHQAGTHLGTSNLRAEEPHSYRQLAVVSQPRYDERAAVTHSGEQFPDGNCRQQYNVPASMPHSYRQTTTFNQPRYDVPTAMAYSYGQFPAGNYQQQYDVPAPVQQWSVQFDGYYDQRQFNMPDWAREVSGHDRRYPQGMQAGGAYFQNPSGNFQPHQMSVPTGNTYYQGQRQHQSFAQAPHSFYQGNVQPGNAQAQGQGQTGYAAQFNLPYQPAQPAFYTQAQQPRLRVDPRAPADVIDLTSDDDEVVTVEKPALASTPVKRVLTKTERDKINAKRIAKIQSEEKPKNQAEHIRYATGMKEPGWLKKTRQDQEAAEQAKRVEKEARAKEAEEAKRKLKKGAAARSKKVGKKEQAKIALAIQRANAVEAPKEHELGAEISQVPATLEFPEEIPEPENSNVLAHTQPLKACCKPANYADEEDDSDDELGFQIVEFSSSQRAELVVHAPANDDEEIAADSAPRDEFEDDLDMDFEAALQADFYAEDVPMEDEEDVRMPVSYESEESEEE